MSRQVRLDGPGWLDGPVVARLEPDDVSLTYDAARHEVLRHASGRAEVVGDDVFDVLAAELDTHGGRWFGYLGYASRPDLPAAPDDLLPDACWMRPSRTSRPTWAGRVLRDGSSLASSGTMPETGLETGLRHTTVQSEPATTPPDWYRHAFDRVQEHLRAGDTYETNLTYRVDLDGPAGVAGADAVHARLRALNPAPYAGSLRHDVPGAAAHLVCASPERFARVDDGWVEARPIKGTTPRSPADPRADAEAARRLADDPRYRAESLMIVDLLRNDVAQVSEVGSVVVPELMVVESHPAVHQLVSTVRGRLGPEVGVVDALRSLFPAGSMTGAPKRRTMEVIGEVESTPRGVYSGAFGWIDASGRADLAVVIRSLTTPGDGRWRLGTGGGITVHSDVDSEWDETGWKAAALRTALTNDDRRPG